MERNVFIIIFAQEVINIRCIIFVFTELSSLLNLLIIGVQLERAIVVEMSIVNINGIII